MISKTINGIEKRLVQLQNQLILSLEWILNDWMVLNGQVFVQFAQQPFAAGGMRVCYKVDRAPSNNKNTANRVDVKYS
jgi:hypothetical protein